MSRSAEAIDFNTITEPEDTRVVEALNSPAYNVHRLEQEFSLTADEALAVSKFFDVLAETPEALILLKVATQNADLLATLARFDSGSVAVIERYPGALNIICGNPDRALRDAYVAIRKRLDAEADDANSPV